MRSDDIAASHSYLSVQMEISGQIHAPSLLIPIKINDTHRSADLGVPEMFLPTGNGNQTVQTSSYIVDVATILVIRVKYI